MALCGFYFCTEQAEVFIGMFIGIANGDTLTVRNHEKQEVKIRLAEINAPEKSQAFGTKQSLSDLCFGKQAETLLKSKIATSARLPC